MKAIDVVIKLQQLISEHGNEIEVDVRNEAGDFDPVTSITVEETYSFPSKEVIVIDA